LFYDAMEESFGEKPLEQRSRVVNFFSRAFK